LILAELVLSEGFKSIQPGHKMALRGGDQATEFSTSASNGVPWDFDPRLVSQMTNLLVCSDTRPGGHADA